MWKKDKCSLDKKVCAISHSISALYLLQDYRMMDVTVRASLSSFSKLLEQTTLYVHELGFLRCIKYCSSCIFIKFAIPKSAAAFRQPDFPTVPVPAISTICI